MARTRGFTSAIRSSGISTRRRCAIACCTTRSFRVINPMFEETFIPSSFSCRVGYSTHRGIDALERMARRTSQNGTRDCFVLKCDVRKFFSIASIMVFCSPFWRGGLKTMMRCGCSDKSLRVFHRLILVCSSGKECPSAISTSQLFANVYMNEFDRFVKNDLRIRNYVRYTDDFAIVADDRTRLEGLIGPIYGLREVRRSPQRSEICLRL